MRHFRWVTLAICFFLDVRVRAEVIEAKHAPKTFDQGNQHLVVDGGGLVELRAKTPHLVRGNLLIESPVAATLSVPFATFTCAKSCRALAKREADHVTFMNLEGAWTYTRMGDTQTYALPMAFQVRVGEVTTAGVAAAEFPQALPWDDTVALWAHLFRGTTAEFKARVSAFRPEWREATEALSEQHAEVANQAIARHVAAVQSAARARAAEDAESADLRALFRRKNGFED